MPKITKGYCKPPRVLMPMSMGTISGLHGALQVIQEGNLAIYILVVWDERLILVDQL